MDPKMLMNLAEMDPVMAALIEKEKSRQFRGIELVASEVCALPRSNKLINEATQ